MIGDKDDALGDEINKDTISRTSTTPAIFAIRIVLALRLRTDSNPCISRPIARMGATTNRGTEKQINEVCVYDNETVH